MLAAGCGSVDDAELEAAVGSLLTGLRIGASVLTWERLASNMEARALTPAPLLVSTILFERIDSTKIISTSY